MIYESLSCVVSDMNEFLRARLKISEDKVVLSALVNQDGSLAVPGENKLVITLQNIERETTAKNSPLTVGRSPATGVSSININIYIIISAYFPGSNYTEALKFISFAISYFQNKNVFTPTNTPQMDGGIEKLIFEMENVSTERMNNVWAALGAKYMPSVMYKMRMLTFDSAALREIRPAVTGVQAGNTAG